MIQLPLGLVAMAVSFAILPTLSQQAQTNRSSTADSVAPVHKKPTRKRWQRNEPFAATLAQGLKLVLVLTIPAAIGMFVLAEPIVGLVFEHGDFDAYDTLHTSQALHFALLGLVFAAVDWPLNSAFYAQQEIYDVLNLLRAVASTADEVSLAGVLRSPFFALADETLFWLIKSAGGLNAALRSEALPTELSPEEHAKTRAAAETIQYLRQRKDSLPIAELITAALARTGYDAVLLAEFLGERKLANLSIILRPTWGPSIAREKAPATVPGTERIFITCLLKLLGNLVSAWRKSRTSLFPTIPPELSCLARPGSVISNRTS